MKRIVFALPLLAALALLTGCMSMGYGPQEAGMYVDTPALTAPVMVPPGAFYQNTKAPLTYDFSSTKAVASKTATAETTYIQLIYPMLSVSFIQDQLMEEALRNGGIKKLSYADYEIFNVLGLYTRFRVIVHGD